MQQRVLVTGYGGFLGSEVVRQLRAAGYRVRGLGRGHYPQHDNLDIEIVRADIRNRLAVLEATKDCDAIIHTAALAGVWGPWRDYYTINTQATSHLLEGAVAHDVQCFVHCSSPSVTFDMQPQTNVDETAPYPTRWLCYYPQTKALAEQAVLQAVQHTRLKTCALRPHLIWGKGDPHLFPRVIAKAKQRRLRRVGDGRNLIDVVHVSHAARAHLLAMETLLGTDRELNGQALFITDGQPVACWDWISRILNTAQVPIPTRSISYAAAYRLGGLCEALFWTVRSRHEPPMTRFVAAQLAVDHYFSIEKARRLIGYRPAIDVDQAFRELGS